MIQPRGMGAGPLDSRDWVTGDDRLPGTVGHSRSTSPANGVHTEEYRQAFGIGVADSIECRPNLVPRKAKGRTRACRDGGSRPLAPSRLPSPSLVAEGLWQRRLPVVDTPGDREVVDVNRANRIWTRASRWRGGSASEMYEERSACCHMR